MSMPGFTAEASLDDPLERYRQSLTQVLTDHAEVVPTLTTCVCIPNACCCGPIGQKCKWVKLVDFGV
jgi:hypothetical protein